MNDPGGRNRQAAAPHDLDRSDMNTKYSLIIADARISWTNHRRAYDFQLDKPVGDPIREVDIEGHAAVDPEHAGKGHSLVLHDDIRPPKIGQE